MINLLYESFPESIEADRKCYPVRTDFRIWLKFADDLHDQNSDQELLAALTSLFTDQITCFSADLINEIFNFYRADGLNFKREFNDEEDDQADAIEKPPVFDWKIDARYVLGDFRRFYQIDLTAVEHLHWWKFRALFDALPDNSQCMKRIAYRGADLSQIKNEAEKTRIRKIKQALALPFEMSDEAIGAAIKF